MGRVDYYTEPGYPTLLLEIQNPADVELAIRILKGEEPLGDIRCVQL